MMTWAICRVAMTTMGENQVRQDLTEDDAGMAPA